MDWHIVLVVLYLMPLVVATLRRQRRVSVGLLNVFLGWTIVGWVVALVIAAWPAPRKLDYVEVPYDGTTYDDLLPRKVTRRG